MDGESVVSSDWFITITLLWVLSERKKQTDSILQTDLSSPNLQILARIVYVTNEPLKFPLFFKVEI